MEHGKGSLRIHCGHTFLSSGHFPIGVEATEKSHCVAMRQEAFSVSWSSHLGQPGVDKGVPAQGRGAGMR